MCRGLLDGELNCSHLPLETTTGDSMNAWAVFTDLGFISLLLLVGALLRAKVKPLQYLFLPASLVAGLLGLVLGPKGLAIIPFSENLGTYAGILIAVVFASLPFTSRVTSFRGVAKNVGRTWAVAQSVTLLQWGLGLLFALTVLVWFFGSLPAGFGLMLAAGFVGGHGTAAAIAAGFGADWEGASSLGMTSATVGIIAAIIGGIIIIKVETRRGNTAFLASFSDLPNELRTGLVPQQKRASIGSSPVSTMSIDPLIYHGGLLIAIATAAYFVSSWAASVLPGITLPVFSVAFIIGYAVLGILKRFKAENYFEKPLFERTSGSSTDLLVAFGVASINPSIVIDYALPLVLLLVFGIAGLLAMYFLVAPRIFKEHRVEQSIFTWGWATGTVAMGMALLRIVDPELKKPDARLLRNRLRSRRDDGHPHRRTGPHAYFGRFRLAAGLGGYGSGFRRPHWQPRCRPVERRPQGDP